MRFKERICFYNIKVKSEASSVNVEAASSVNVEAASSVNVEAAASDSEDLAKIINGGGYSQEQASQVAQW